MVFLWFSFFFIGAARAFSTISHWHFISYISVGFLGTFFHFGIKYNLVVVMLSTLNWFDFFQGQQFDILNTIHFYPACVCVCVFCNRLFTSFILCLVYILWVILSLFLVYCICSHTWWCFFPSCFNRLSVSLLILYW